ncbi:hypothetical protein [Symbiobacterium terraclitae]|uniref:hypothetical protein n=1 Tax=Symbiobacterium terraclitae TaxID=557451 RepID=UPI0035B55E30
MDAASDRGDLLAGGDLLRQAAAAYARTLGPEDYWWLGVGLAASTLADLQEKEYALRRIQQLMDRLGRTGVEGDWFERFLVELAALDAEGLLWPRYERDPDGEMVPTGVAVNPAFDAESGYILALAHLAIARAVNEGDGEAVAPLAEAIGQIVAEGLRPEHRAQVRAALEIGVQEP